MSFWNKLEKTNEPPEFTPPRAEPPPPPATAAAMAPERVPARVPERAPERVPERAPARAEIPYDTQGADLRLGRGVRLEGKLTFSGTVRVDATFQGSIITDGVLVVGEQAKVDAQITCGTVIVEGEVNGDVTASSAVEVHSTGRLHGDVETPIFAIDRGAIFEGRSRRPGGTSSDRRNGKAAAAS